ncbi:hypothetical protein IHE45_07G056400 [Dioscorea alata]|uniref:Uncharacterized protein n=1 Tax=Dioscorea alata TaxID=55571 RepID=A0ACB7VQZ6_DIOAL|nr:hypothetical protein IHE45_07G056400 [Dioscorea alata]
MSSRSKREECKSIEHDSYFSKWQVLIGPKDWEDYALGKDGVGRYRIHNLPQCFSCSGLYELAISKIPTEGHKSREPPLDTIVVVYLGHSDNVRARLQSYGRAGSHLERGNLSVCVNNYKDLCLVKGPGLFKEAFSKGYSILFRWAPMTDKEEAKKIESKLLDTFDYPWNTRANGTSRRDDVLKISSTITGQPIPKVLNNLQEWKQLTFNKKVGIMIGESVPPDKLGSSNYLQHYLIPLVRKGSTIQPRPNEGGEVLNSGYDICGVTDADGSICRRKPVLRNKRCLLHKGKWIILNGHITSKEASSSKDSSSLVHLPIEDTSRFMELPCNGTQQCEKVREISPTENPNTMDESKDVEHDHSEENHICGVLLSDGNVCRSKPLQGRKRCEDHKGMRVTGIVSMATKGCLAKEISPTENFNTKDESEDVKHDHSEENHICGVLLSDGDVCRSKPLQGRKRCEDHKGMRVTGIVSMETKGCLTKEISSELDPSEKYKICGVLLGDGNVCQSKPFQGRKRCEDHEGMRVTGSISLTTGECSTKGIPSATKLDPCEEYQICGVFFEDGNVCRSKPFSGRKRCEDHKGMRVNGIIPRTAKEFTTTNITPFGELGPCEGSQICGVLLGDGNVCRSRPSRGRERCEDHKGMRVNSIVSRTIRECSITNVSSRAATYHFQEYKRCGVSLANGNVCQRMPVQGRQRCEVHKGQRIRRVTYD